MLASWLWYLMHLRPDQIILAEGGFRDFPLPAALAAFVIARGNVWMMALGPPKQPVEQARRLIPLLARERMRGRLVRGVVAVSHGVKDRLVRVYGYSPEKVSVIYNGVDTDRFSPPPREARRLLRRNLQIPDQAVVLVSTARLDGIKRLDRLIRAFGTLSLERNDLWLLFVGDGPLSGELKDLAKSVNNSENMRFLGHMKDVRAILWTSDVYVLPSDEESFGIALAEAMACKLVCVATKTMGPSEIIEDGLSGFLAEPTDDGVLQGIQRALRLSQREREEIGNRSRQRVLDNFRIQEAVTKGLAFMQIDSA
jgi:L-malate glycosyltransferase